MIWKIDYVGEGLAPPVVLLEEKGMVLLVIDAQQGICNEKLYRFDAFVSTVQTLLSRAREKGVEVIFVRHDDGAAQMLTKGNAAFEVDASFAPLPGEKVFDKKVNSPFRSSGLLEYLQEKGEKDLMAVGLQTDYCMDATVKCGFEHGFRMIVPEGGNTTFDNDFMTGEQTYAYYNHFMWPKRYAKCVTVQEAVQMICK